MSDPVEDTPGQTPDDRRGLLPSAPSPERRAKSRYLGRLLMLTLGGALLFGLCLMYVLLFPLPWRDREAGDTCEVEIAPGVKMAFCWIPKGDCQLGSPKSERYAAIELFEGSKKLEFLQDEAEENRPTFHTDGFWMGKYEVTQAEWKAVMGNNPSWSRVGGGGAGRLDSITDTSKFPVERVSWDMICEKGGFLDRVNDHGGIRKALGKSGKFRLPHEDEWEYACRGGGGNEQPFYWGKTLNGTEANCDGNSPYGTNVKGQYLRRTCAVDFTNTGEYPSHPWGLMHMHGNVSEWCDNLVEKTNLRVLRGGTWNSFPAFCRAAERDSDWPASGRFDVGFRVCFRLD